GVSGEEADGLVGPPQRRDDQLQAAQEFLAQTLAAGPVPARQILSQAAAELISEKTLRRAKRALGVSSKRADHQHEGDQWLWSLPDPSSSSSTGAASSSSPRGAMPDGM